MVTPPPTQGRLRRNLLIAFLLCLLFAPLALAMGRLFPLLNYTNCVFAVVTVVSASAILYPSCLQKKRRLVRVCTVLLVGVVLFVCATFLWLATIVLVIRPFPI